MNMSVKSAMRGLNIYKDQMKMSFAQSAGASHQRKSSLYFQKGLRQNSLRAKAAFQLVPQAGVVLARAE